MQIFGNSIDSIRKLSPSLACNTIIRFLLKTVLKKSKTNSKAQIHIN